MLREYQCSFRARNVRLIPVIRKNAETFARAGAAEIGTQRAGDQFGALLAGAYACFSVSEISLEGAREWIAGQDWSEYRVKENELDESRCLDKILQTCIKVQGDRGSVFDMSIGEAILIADGKVTHSVLNFETAHDTLKRNGIRILYDKDSDESVFAVSNTHSAIEKFMEKTPWQKNWGQLLSRLPRAKTTGATYFGPGYTARAVSIPVDLLAGE
jgi:putative DNA primase/helicase